MSAPELPVPWQDPLQRLPRKLPARAWILAVVVFAVTYVLMYSVVHIYVDRRACLTTLPDDPGFHLVPKELGWYLVSRLWFEWITIASLLALFVRAYRGDHRPLLRWALALDIQGILRCVTITLLPLCRITVTPGKPAITEIPMLDLGFARIPWRPFASNDLVFSGHVGEFLLLTWATRHWPRPLRAGLIVFQILQAYALLATRGHYTIDMVLAIPCAFFSDSMSIELLAWLSRRKRRPQAPEPAPS